MLIYLLRRLAIALCVALTVSVVSFTLLHLSGDLAVSIAGPEATAAQVESVRTQFGLDRPLTTQYVTGWAAPCSSTSASPSTSRGR